VWAALVEGESRRALVLTLLLGAPLLMSGLALACPDLGEYRGLSGLDTALVIELILLRGFAAPASGIERGFGPWLTRRLGRSFLRRVGSFSLGLSAVKIGYEFCVGHALLARDLGNGVALLPEAHALGAVVGLAVYYALPRATRRGGRGSIDSIADSAVLKGAHFGEFILEDADAKYRKALGCWLTARRVQRCR
jgi:hypothetical protein